MYGVYALGVPCTLGTGYTASVGGTLGAVYGDACYMYGVRLAVGCARCKCVRAQSCGLCAQSSGCVRIGGGGGAWRTPSGLSGGGVVGRVRIGGGGVVRSARKTCNPPITTQF